MQITQLTQANAVFAVLPREVRQRLQAEFPFYVWNPTINEVRLMCSWDTTPEEVDTFVKLAGELVA